MVTVGLTFLMGIMGLVVDVGWGYFRKQVGQAAVDSAVLAAMVQATKLSSSTLFNCGSNGVVCQDPTPCTAATDGTVIATACQYAIKNGVAADKIYISANTTSPHNGVNVSYWLTATTSEGLSLGFLRMIGASSATVGASASGGVIVHNGSGGGCLYSLDPRSTASLHVGGASLTSTTCESTPCSAWDRRSAATNTGSASRSATTSTSEGPAGISIATSDETICFAHVTY